MTLALRITCLPLAGQAAKMICLAAPVTPSSVTIKQAQAAMTRKTKITIFIYLIKIEGRLLWCLL